VASSVASVFDGRFGVGGPLRRMGAVELALAGCGKTRAVRPFPVGWKRKSLYPRVIVPALSAGFIGIRRFEADSWRG
jgi:hypothetical protein